MSHCEILFHNVRAWKVQNQMRNEEPSGIVVLLIQDVLNKAILH